uniref:HGH1 protein n=1 Tax=Macrostomum lignano TaxID=282301 RepID=A0A1I8I9K7_9PLAT
PGQQQQQEPQQALLRLTDRLTARCPYSARLLAAAAVAGGRPGCLQRLLRPALTGHPKLLLQALDVIELHDSDAIADCLLQRLLSAADWRLRRHLLRSAGALLAEEASQERRRLAGALGRQLPRLLRLLDAGPGPAGVADLLALTGRLEFHRS